MSADPDGDSEMLSSSGSASPADGARTPTFNNPLSEFSPPGSQTASHHGASMGSPGASFDNTNRGPFGDAKTLSTWQQQQQQQQPQSSKEPTGASWNNQKAQEEYARALESVVDREFSLQEFGDPFDESDLLEGPVGK